MLRPLPSLTALRAFEAAARHLSLTRAALELHVTPGALSHQIKGLEAFLGVRLFQRLPRAMRLTELGRRLQPGLHDGFERIRHAVDSARPSGADRVLVISTPPGFTAKWLVPRLYRFLQAQLEIDARVSAAIGYANFHDDGVDVAIRNLRHDAATDPDLLVEHLCDLVYVPVCSPRFLQQTGTPRASADLARMALIHDDMQAGQADVPNWADWFARAGVNGVDASRGLRLNSADHALEAAVEGAGVLLAIEILALDDIRDGRLVVPVDLRVHARRAFYFVCPRAYERRAHVQAFRQWIKGEMGGVGPE